MPEVTRAPGDPKTEGGRLNKFLNEFYTNPDHGFGVCQTCEKRTVIDSTGRCGDCVFENPYGKFCDKCEQSQYWDEIKSENDPISYGGDGEFNVCKECQV